MSRQAFIESHGGTCKNWQWSWSFVNHDKKFVIFGASDVHEIGEQQLILSKDWSHNNSGQQSRGYNQGLEHINLITKQNYQLKTYRQAEFQSTQKTDGVKIKLHKPVLEDRLLLEKEGDWFAFPKEHVGDFSSNFLPPKKFLIEGTRVPVSSVAVERNADARQRCIDFFGLKCSICSFDFEETYGKAGEGFIHVHHLKPLSEADGPRIVDPERDLIPVCPNCHAIIHRDSELRSVETMKVLLNQQTKSSEK